jgi:hypothetical protein
VTAAPAPNPEEDTPMTTPEPLDLSAQPVDRPYVAEMIPLNQGWNTDWLVSYASGVDPEDDHAGWLTVNANARTGMVDFGEELTPTEARNLALALIEAARHAESYGYTVATALTDEQMYSDPEMDAAPVETQRAINGWINRAVARAQARAAVARKAVTG